MESQPQNPENSHPCKILQLKIENWNIFLIFHKMCIDNSITMVTRYTTFDIIHAHFLYEHNEYFKDCLHFIKHMISTQSRGIILSLLIYPVDE